MALSFIIWNGNPEIFSIGSFALRWYGLLFALGFLISQQILYYIYKKEGKPQSDVDTLTIYMVVATVVGARLGHIIFYQPEMLWQNPVGIFLPFEFNPFRFTGLQGLASHGGAFGILFALWLYSSWSIRFSRPQTDSAVDPGGVSKKKYGLFIKRKHIPGQNYLQVLDRIVIVVSLTGALIRLGNFFNSEIIGKPTNAPFGVVFAAPVTSSIFDAPETPVDELRIKKDTSLAVRPDGRVPLDIYLFFKPKTTQYQVTGFINGQLRQSFQQLDEFVDQSPFEPVRSQISETTDGTFGARVKVWGIARHPAQLYESFSCLLLFLFLFWYWSRYKEKLPEGRIFGMFMIILWSLRFAYEFIKENQVPFEETMRFNRGQQLSVPLVAVGIIVLLLSFRKKAQAHQTPDIS